MKMHISKAKTFLRALRAGPYAWPGCYPVYFVMTDGGALSFAAAYAERKLIVQSLLAGDRRSGWHVEGADINWEDDALYCDHTGERIASAYGDQCS